MYSQTREALNELTLSFNGIIIDAFISNRQESKTGLIEKHRAASRCRPGEALPLYSAIMLDKRKEIICRHRIDQISAYS